MNCRQGDAVLISKEKTAGGGWWITSSLSTDSGGYSCKKMRTHGPWPTGADATIAENHTTLLKTLSSFDHMP